MQSKNYWNKIVVQIDWILDIDFIKIKSIVILDMESQKINLRMIFERNEQKLIETYYIYIIKLENKIVFTKTAQFYSLPFKL